MGTLSTYGKKFDAQFFDSKPVNGTAA